MIKGNLEDFIKLILEIREVKKNLVNAKKYNSCICNGVGYQIDGCCCKNGAKIESYKDKLEELIEKI